MVAAVTVRLRDERSFDASAARLFALLTDPRFQEARSAHLGTLEARARRWREGGALVVALDEVRDTGWRPHLFESRHTVRWDPAARTGRWTLVQTGGPGEAGAAGRIAIRDEGPGRCRLALEGTLHVRVPVLGPMIERIAARALRAERAKEARFVAARLADQRKR